MRSLLGQLVAQLLAVFLLLTTPFGTGDGLHQNELLHPVLPHVHTINGQIVSDQQLAMQRAAQDALSASTEPTRGRAIGAGAGADAAGPGIALGPTLPAAVPLDAHSAEARLTIADATLPAEFRAEPPDPPPVPFA
jgi:hypothetical protein